jgi:REP element-mobilizing transposase RayT
MNRGRRGEHIFADQTDYDSFLAVLQEASELFGARVAAYCLMTNHYHLLVQTPAGNIARVMRQINGLYTQRYNRRRGFDGQLFRGRYKSTLVEEDTYLLELLRYIHRNPVRAGIVEHVADYPWSSHHGYVSKAKKRDWLYKDQLLGMFSGASARARKAYCEFVELDDSPAITTFFSKKNLSSVLGSEDFVNWVKGKYYLAKKHEEVPESKALAPTIAEIELIVCDAYGVERESLLHARRGQTNMPRNVAIYLCRKLAALRHSEIGEAFGSVKSSSVSSAILRMESLLAEDRKLSREIGKIIRKLNKS